MAKKKHTPMIAVNRKARYKYHILGHLEAGIVLLGTEVKSVRAHNVDLSTGFASIEHGEVLLRDVYIKPYEFGNQFNHESRRPRRLLLHRKEIDKLLGKLTATGLTLVPLSLYFNRLGKVKVELGLCRGQRKGDKRDILRKKAADDEMKDSIR